MGGNVSEWNESIVLGFQRGLRDGSFLGFEISLRAVNCFSNAPTVEVRDVGFRVVQIPGPSAAAVLVIGGLGVLRRRR